MRGRILERSRQCCTWCMFKRLDKPKRGRIQDAHSKTLTGALEVIHLQAGLLATGAGSERKFQFAWFFDKDVSGAVLIAVRMACGRALLLACMEGTATHIRDSRPMIMDFVHPGTALGTLSTMMGSLKTVPARASSMDGRGFAT